MELHRKWTTLIQDEPLIVVISEEEGAVST